MAKILKNKLTLKHKWHPFHLVYPSPWPLLILLSVFTLVLGLVLAFNLYGSLFHITANLLVFFFLYIVGFYIKEPKNYINVIFFILIDVYK